MIFEHVAAEKSSFLILNTGCWFTSCSFTGPLSATCCSFWVYVYYQINRQKSMKISKVAFFPLIIIVAETCVIIFRIRGHTSDLWLFCCFFQVLLFGPSLTGYHKSIVLQQINFDSKEQWFIIFFIMFYVAMKFAHNYPSDKCDELPIFLYCVKNCWPF